MKSNGALLGLSAAAALRQSAADEPRKGVWNMRWKAIWMSAAIVVCAGCASGASGAVEGRGVRLPAVLHGTWEVGPEPCKLPGNPDSDSRIVIEERKINGYESWSEVLAVTRISASPVAWRLRTREHYYEEVHELDIIVSVTDQDQGSLIKIDQSRAAFYVRCT